MNSFAAMANRRHQRNIITMDREVQGIPLHVEGKRPNTSRPRLLGIPGGQTRAGGAVLAIADDLVLLQHPEVLGRLVRPRHVGRVEDITEFAARQP
jgi:hypothetical protein